MDLSQLGQGLSMGLLPMLLGGFGNSKGKQMGQQIQGAQQSLGELLNGPKPVQAPGGPSPGPSPSPTSAPVPTLSSLMQPQVGTMPTGDQVRSALSTDSAPQIMQQLMRFLPQR